MKKKREMIPQPEVLAWLQTHFPQLHAAAEVERAWVWLVCDLRGEANKPIRQAIKDYGFIFARHGGHLLPSGKKGTWGHACERPMPFKRRGPSAPKGQDQPATHPNPETPQPEQQPEAQEDFDLLAFALGE